MFSINQTASQTMNERKQLYIPLCFLLIRAVEAVKCLAEILYIPLCFLLIVRLFLSGSLHELLYIPLCFLLISVSQIQTNRIALFTFHYVFY